MIQRIRALLTLLNILNGDRALTKALGQFDKINSKLAAAENQLHEEMWERTVANGALYEKIGKNRNLNEAARLRIQHAARVSDRIREFLS